MTVTPLKLEILLWYYARANDFRNGEFTTPAVRDAIDEFRDDRGMLEQAMAGTGRAYCLTAKGKFYVEHLLNTPYPICSYKIPERPDA